MINSILYQIKQRRLTLGLKQNDMMLRIGVSRQQYQRLESKGNPRLDTLELVAKGLNSELMLIPNEKLSAVMAALEQEPSALQQKPSAIDQQSLEPNRDPAAPVQKSPKSTKEDVKKSLSDNPWQGLLGGDE